MPKPFSVLAFAYVYPPDAGSGTYRTLYFTNHWARQGVRITIITVKESSFLKAALVDHGLSRQVHPSISVVRASAARPLERILAVRNIFRRSTTPASGGTPGEGSALESRPPRGALRVVKDTITDLLTCPDEHVGWVPYAIRAAHGLGRETEFDCIYGTGGPWSSLLAARAVSRLRGLPLVLDFRDPWAGNPNLTRRSPLSRRMQARMESLCVHGADLVVANTEELRQDFVARYGDVTPDRFMTVTNGFEEIPHATETTGASQRFTLVHAGALYQSRSPLNFLKAVAGILNDAAIPLADFRVLLVGGISVSDPAVQFELRSERLRNAIEVIPRVSHEEALELQRRASALMLIQTGFPLQVPRKLYEYLSLARPILAIAETGSATARMVSELRAGYVVADNEQAIRGAILKLYGAWTTGAAPEIDRDRLRQYSNQFLAERLLGAMRRVAEVRGRAHV